MTKKDHKLIAEAISEHRRMFACSGSYALAYRLSQKLAQDNDRFDKVKFLKACGVV